MSRLMGVFATAVLMTGCYVETHESGTGTNEDDACSSGHAANPEAPVSPAPSGTTEADAAAPGCKTHADCAPAEFCLLGSGTCSPAASCSAEKDCAPGFNCDAAQSVCLPAAAETCAELADETACIARKDCAAAYAGVDCSCGPDCQCVGGEPGCVCASFEFFRCEAVSF